MKNSRIWDINSYIQIKGEAHLKELASLYPGVSEMTIRRDLDFLEKNGYVVRTRGGAKSINHLTQVKEDVYSARANENVDAKSSVARKALAFVNVHSSLYFDCGTTISLLCTMIPDEDFFAITSGVNISLELCKRKKPNVVIVGGKVNPDNLSVSGPSAVKQIDSLNIDTAFIATSGFSPRTGFTVGSFEESELKRAVIDKSKKVVLLMDSSKIDRYLPYTFANLSDIDFLISESPFPDEIQKLAEEQQVTLL